MNALQRWAAYAGGAVLALASAFFIGWHACNRWTALDREEAKNAAVEAALSAERKAAAAKAVLDKSESEKSEARTVQTVYLTKEVTKYVEREKSAPTGTIAVLDSEWVRLHDAAANPPGAKPVLDAGSQPSTAGEALAAVTDNYGECYKWRDQVIGWQEWYSSN
jgi:hypothetical protein